MRTRNAAVAVVGTAGLLTGLVSTAGATPTNEAATERGVCKGVKDCYVMGHVDVTGDGKRDWIGAVNHNGRKIKKGKVTVRILSTGKVDRKRLTVRRWKGDVFHGIAKIDGHRGAELVVGAKRTRFTSRYPMDERPTHTYSKNFHVLTMRHGKLVRAKSPGDKSRTWSLTSPRGTRAGNAGQPPGIFSHVRGYTRGKAKGRVTMVRKDVQCGGVVGCSGSKVKFAWKRGHWAKVSKKSIRPGNKGGWHVKGLDVW